MWQNIWPCFQKVIAYELILVYMEWRFWVLYTWTEMDMQRDFYFKLSRKLQMCLEADSMFSKASKG